MSKRLIPHAAVLLLGLACFRPLCADQIVGTFNTDFSKPFGDGTVTRYEQFYDSSDFSGPLDITGLGFYVDLNNYFLNNGDPSTFSTDYTNEYQVYLTTLTSVDLSKINGASLPGPPLVEAQPSLTVLDANTGFLTLTFTNPFNYDFSGGLLLDLVNVAPDFSENFLMFADSSLSSSITDTGDCGTGCVYDGLNSDPVTGDPLGQFGLVTDFITSTVPEPSSLVLLATVITALAFVLRRRATARRNRASTQN